MPPREVPSLDPEPVIKTNNRILASARFANLTVHLLRLRAFSGQRLFRGYGAPRQFLALPAALVQGLARIQESGEDRQVDVENLSPAQDLFIRAGDLAASGSRPTHCFANDLILPASSGRVPVRPRLIRPAPAPVAAAHLADRTQDCLRALGGLAGETPHATGAVVALHGQFRRGELFATADLFRQCWPGLLLAATLEAASAWRERDDAMPAGSPDVADQAGVLAWLTATHGCGARRSRRPISWRVIEITRSTADQISVATLDQGQGKLCVHRSVVAINREGSTGRTPPI